jgi:DNA-directed RNA polymerase subunit N (RpoN/RPB10)
MGLATNPAIQRISKLLADAFLQHGEKIRQELIESYRAGALSRYEAFIAASQRGLMGRIYGTGRGSFDGWHHYTSYDKEAAYEEWHSRHPQPGDAAYKTIPPDHISTWEEVRRWAQYLSVDYREAQSNANQSYEDARDGFVTKNVQKLGAVLGGRTDLVDAEVRFRWSRGVFAGNMDVALSDAKFSAELGLKYVVRHIPRTTPYFQYPLLFTSATVKGASHFSPSEDELRVLLGGKSAKVLESQRAAEEAAQGLCPMSGQHVPQAVMAPIARRMSPYVKCPACGAVVSAQHWKYKKHKTPGAERAGVAQKLETAGYCAMSREKMPAHLVAAMGPVEMYKDPKGPCEACGQQVRLDAQSDLIRDQFLSPEGYGTKRRVTSATYYKHKLAK